MCKYIVILLSMLHKLPRAHSEPLGIIPHFNSANSCSIFEQNTFFNFIHASFIGVFFTKKNYKNCLKWPYCKERWKCHWPVLNLVATYRKAVYNNICGQNNCPLVFFFLKTFMDIGSENKQQDKCFSL